MDANHDAAGLSADQRAFARLGADHRVQAVRPAHGGHPDPQHPTVDQRLAAYLRDLDAGETVRLGYVPDTDPVHPGQFVAIAYRGADLTFGASPLRALDDMLVELGQ